MNWIHQLRPRNLSVISNFVKASGIVGRRCSVAITGRTEMQITSDVGQTQKHMAEKLGWAGRCVERMIAAASSKDETDVQDHFWSFLHASRLVWFYLGEFHHARGDAKGAAKITMKSWTDPNLDSDEKRVWDAIANLRTEDVHTRPVDTVERTEGHLVSRNGHLVKRNGHLCKVTATRHIVSDNSTEFDAIDLASRAIKLLTQFVEDFPSLVPERDCPIDLS